MRRVTIASGSELAARSGAAIADAGGNAVDAAIAAVITSMCTDPGIIAPLGGAFITIWPEDGDPVVIDAYAEMPGRGLPTERRGKGAWEVHLDYGGGMRTVIGYGSAATPGAFAGLGRASRRFGRLPWEALLQPAIAATDAGFPLSGAAAEYLVYAHDTIFGWDPDSWAALHHADGTPLAAGDLVKIPGLAHTLERIAAEGPEILYTGELAARIADEVQAHEGLITREDLATYRPIEREPIRVPVDDWELATNPPPAVGGACLAAMLLLLDSHPFTAWTEAEVTTLARVQRAVLRYRRHVLDIADDRAGAAARLLELARVGDLASIVGSPSTIHTSAVDSAGLACSVTVSAGYGSGAMVKGTGLWLNNSLGELELQPAGIGGLEPGTRLLSNMAPSVARRPDGSVLAIGSPGADRITTAIAQVMLNFVHLGMSLRDAIAHPRLHVEAFDGKPTIAHEPGLPVRPIDDLTVRRFPDLSMYFGGVAAALWDPVAGLFAGADPRRAGAVARGGIE